jgi:hypothetical protein
MDDGPDCILRLLQLGRWKQGLIRRDVRLCLRYEWGGSHCSDAIDVGEVSVSLRKSAIGEIGRRGGT